MFWPTQDWGYVTRSNSHAIALIEKRGINVALAGIGKTLVTPGRTPAIAYDEALVWSVADNAHGVAATNSVGLEDIEIPMGRCGVIPGCVHAQSSHDWAMCGKPSAPRVEILAQVEIGSDTAHRRSGVECVLVAQIHAGRDVERQEGFKHRPILAQEFHGSLQARASALDECFRAIGELVGFLRRHPRAARRQPSGFGQLASPDHMIARDAIGRGPADTRTGRFLVANIPPGGAEIHTGGQGRSWGSDGLGLNRTLDAPVALGIA